MTLKVVIRSRDGLHIVIAIALGIDSRVDCQISLPCLSYIRVSNMTSLLEHNRAFVYKGAQSSDSIANVHR